MRIVGRDAELSAVEWFLDAVREGTVALLWRGEAGIGKTTLWEETLRSARSRGMSVLACRPGQSETKLSLSGLADMLVDLGERELASLPEPQRRGIEVALLRRDPLGEDTDWRTTAAGLLSALDEMARIAPVVLAVDDAQWLDRATARVLEYATRRLGDRHVGLVVSIRDQHEEPLGIPRSFQQERWREVQLGPLSLASLHHIVAAQLDQRFPRPILVRLHELSGGNPFYALEIARALGKQQEPLRLGDALPLPSNLSFVPAERMDDLSQDASEALLAAALLANPTFEAIRAAVGPGTAVGLAEAEDRGLVRVEKDRINFPHPLLRATVYDRASGSAKRRMHRRVAETIGEPEQRAGHLAQGTSPPDREVASALEEAARMAGARGAPDAAAQHAEQARRFTPTNDEHDLRQRTVQAAEHHFDAGDAPRARTLLAELCTSLPPGAERAEMRWRLAKAMRHERSYSEAAAVLSEGLVDAGGDPVMRFTILQDLTFDVLVIQGVPDALPLAHAAVSSADDTGDPVARSEAIASLAFVDFLAGRGFPNELRRRSWPALGTAGPKQVSRTAVVLIAGVLMWSDDLDGARVLYEQAYRHTRDRGSEIELYDLLWQMTELECFAGRWDVAERYASEARAITVLGGYADGDMSSLAASARVDALRGRIEPARQQAQHSFETAQRIGSLMGMGNAMSVSGFIALSAGDPEATRRILGPLMQLAVAVGIDEPAMGRFVPDGLEALIALGELEEAEPILELFEQRAAALDRVWALATGARCRAVLLAARGDLEGAAEGIERCLLEHQRLAMPFELARSLLAAGQIHRRRRQKRAANDSLEAARVIFEELGAPLWVRKAEAEIGRVGLRPRAPAVLTPSEQRVAELAASGLTTRQVAEAAFLTPKSVEGVLTRVYRKLGIRSRAELGAWMAGHEPEDPPPVR